MSQGRVVVEPIRRATTIIVGVSNDLTIKFGTEPQVKVESDKPVGVTRHRLGTRLTVADDIQKSSHHGVMASGAGSVAVGGNSTGIISTGAGSRNAQYGGEPAIDTSRPVRGTTITVPEGVEVVVEIANSLTIDPSAQTTVRVTDNR